MSDDAFDNPTPDVPRDRWSRPLVVPPGGGKAVAYTRCTTFVGCLEDTYNLAKWQQRMVALGLADRPDLALAVAAHRDDKRRLDGICEDALEAAKASAAATTGTALHALCEQIDRGRTLGIVPDSAKADLEAYRRATEILTPLDIERFAVLDDLRIGGTPDRRVNVKGCELPVIADIKTGSIDYGIGKIAMQLAVYARSVWYNHITQRRESFDVDRDRALVIHLPAGQATCSLVWVDIAAGWEAVQLAADVRAWRARKDLATPFVKQTIELADLIMAAPDVDILNNLWLLHQAEWTQEHTDLAAARKALLMGGAA